MPAHPKSVSASTLTYDAGHRPYMSTSPVRSWAGFGFTVGVLTHVYTVRHLGSRVAAANSMCALPTDLHLLRHAKIDYG